MDYNELAPKESVARAIQGLVSKKYEVFQVANGAEALAKIKELIPGGASVMNGSSVTLEEIGYIDYLKEGKHGWINPKDGILAEKDAEKQAQLRRQALLSDYYLGSVHGVAENGEFIVGSNSASQLPHIVYSSPNLIFVVSTKKIVSTLEDAQKRLREFVVPQEDIHMMQKYNVHTTLNKELIFHGESAFSKRKITFILVNEKLGF